MILDRLEESGRYTQIHPLFPRAFDALARADLRSLPAGRYPIEGERLYLVITNEEGKGTDGAVLESHRKYIDIQFVVEGTDMIGWRPAAECPDVIARYDPSKDVELYGEKPHAWSRVTGSAFALFFPSDAHAPLGGTGLLRKAIVKVGI